MELRHLRYFVASAEEQHLGRAARRLNVAEPTLSLQIRHLERELDVPLFERLPRGVKLTAAGIAFLDHARRTLVSVQEAVEHAQRVQRGEVGSLRVGHVTDAAPRGGGGDVIGRLIAAFRLRHPQVHVETAQSTSAEQWAALREGRLDVAIVFSPPEDAAGFRSEVLAELWITGALLPASHRLAWKTTLRCRDLSALPLLMLPRRAHPVVYDAILRALGERGLKPRLVDEHYMSDLTVGLGTVAAGAGWIPVTATLGESLARVPGIAYRDWADPPLPFFLHLLSREDERSVLVARFIALARELRDEVPAPPTVTRADANAGRWPRAARPSTAASGKQHGGADHPAALTDKLPRTAQEAP